MGLYVRVQGRGKVISQNLTPGTVAKKGSVISINLQ
jgi:beta-lactam-binding protein with PASTA domain